MGFSDRILGRKNVNGGPRIESVVPAAALAGGEIRISGSGLRPSDLHRPKVQFGEVEGSIVVSSDSFLIARVPDGATSGPVVVATNGHVSNPQPVKVAVPVAENLHPVTNPALDAQGNIYATFSGSRGQKVPVAIFKIDTNYTVKPFVAEMMNATAIAFDRNQNLYVGDRSGTIFKIGRDQQVFVFATLEPSVSAYHLAFSPQGDLFVTGPTTSSYDSVHKIDPHGTVSTFYRGLGRPQGLAFDVEGNLYVAASLAGKRGIVKLTPDGKANLEVAGQGLVGLAFAPGRAVILSTTSTVHHLSWNIQGLPLLPE